MKVALTGGTCVGKTSVLKQLAKQPEWSVRSCGGVVAETAKDLGITPDALSNKHHLEIDNATRQFFVAHDVPMAIDGRFLTYVLAEAANNLFVVELSATSEVRAERATKRGRESITSSEDLIKNSDAHDKDFCEKMYANIVPLCPNIIIDTSLLTVDEVTQRILQELEIFRAKFCAE